MSKATFLSVVCGALVLGAASAAMGQVARPFNPAPRQGFEPDAPESIPPVSPYVNLGVNSNGLSNYAALVRPLVQEREARRRQSLAAKQPVSPTRGEMTRSATLVNRGNAVGQTNRRPTVRFMHYSHYFGDAR